MLPETPFCTPLVALFFVPGFFLWLTAKILEKKAGNLQTFFSGISHKMTKAGKKRSVFIDFNRLILPLISIKFPFIMSMLLTV
jgi:hypothetical protein